MARTTDRRPRTAHRGAMVLVSAVAGITGCGAGAGDARVADRRPRTAHRVAMALMSAVAGIAGSGAGAGDARAAGRRPRTAHRVAMVLMLAVAGIAGSGAGASDARAADGVPLPALVKAAKGETCVEPVPVIRREHMKFLMHQRDDTVHEGIRTTRHSLVGCIDCHAAKDAAGQWVRIDAPGQFCASCHAYVSVEIDCFGCHAALPAVAFGEGANER